MTVGAKRTALDLFCSKQESCFDCKLHIPQLKCGRGETFLGSDMITSENDTILAYALAFGNEPDNVNHPAHYQGKHECIDEMISLFGIDAVIGFCKCNVYKYRYRADKKNGEEDLKKAEWYIDKLIELEKERDS